MARLASTAEPKARAARQMRATATLLDNDHPEMMAGDHLRDAARLTEHGSNDGAKRHLDAAMFMLTPQSLVRHGITDDDGHQDAKHHMHQINRHRLAVQDIEDISARNDRVREAVRAKLTGQEPQQPEQVPPGQIAASRPPGPALDLAFYDIEPRSRDGKWTTGAGIFGSHVSRKEAAGFAAMFGPPGKKHQRPGGSRDAKAARHAAEASALNHTQRKVYDKLRARGRPHKFAMQAAQMPMNQLAKSLSKAMAGMAGDSPAVQLAFSPAELRGSHGQWIRVPGGSRKIPFNFNGDPGGMGHIQAVMAQAEEIRPFSDTAANAVHNAGEALAGRRMKDVAIHLAVAAREMRGTGSASTIASIADSMRNVPKGVQWATPHRTLAPRSISVNQPGRKTGPGYYQNPATAMAGSTPAVLLSARTAMLERTPAPRGRPGGPGLYDVKGMGHTPYLQQIVKALIEKRGMPPGKAYAIARGAIRKWMRGGGHVHPEVVAASARAEAGELAKQARAHTHTAEAWEVADVLIELAADPGVIELFNPNHAPPGTGGGQFTSKGGGGQGKQQAAKQDRRADHAQRQALARKIAGLRQQISALQAQLPSRARSKSATPAKRGAAATSAKQAAQGKATAAKAGKTATRMSPATIHAKIAALRATLAADIAQLRAIH